MWSASCTSDRPRHRTTPLQSRRSPGCSPAAARPPSRSAAARQPDPAPDLRRQSRRGGAPLAQLSRARPEQSRAFSGSSPTSGSKLNKRAEAIALYQRHRARRGERPESRGSGHRQVLRDRLSRRAIWRGPARPALAGSRLSDAGKTGARARRLSSAARPIRHCARHAPASCAPRGAMFSERRLYQHGRGG